MPESWIDTERDGDADKRTEDFWAAMRAELDAGDFWADRIKSYHGEPAARLKIALAHLPLPGAFKEAAIAARALIRANRKKSEPFNEELTLLYWLAAIRSFMLDYAPRLKEPGFNVVESMPGKKIRSLRFEYRQLGYRKLSLLNKTDCKWLVEGWGEPDGHTTLNALHGDVWEEYETRLIAKRKGEEQRFQAEIKALLTPEEPPSRVSPWPPKSGCMLGLAVAAIALFIGWWWVGN